jgi:hypothetical protein
MLSRNFPEFPLTHNDRFQLPAEFHQNRDEGHRKAPTGEPARLHLEGAFVVKFRTGVKEIAFGREIWPRLCSLRGDIVNLSIDSVS